MPFVSGSIFQTWNATYKLLNSRKSSILENRIAIAKMGAKPSYFLFFSLPSRQRERKAQQLSIGFCERMWWHLQNFSSCANILFVGR